MYKKKLKFNLGACDLKLVAICNELLSYNEDALFVISKNYLEKNGFFEEVGSMPIIVSSIPLEELKLPSYYVLKNNNLMLWTGDEIIVKLIYSNLVFTDGNINDKKIDDLYLNIENNEYIKSLKGM